MKYLMTLFLFTTTIFAFGQINIGFGQLINSWTEGEIDENGKVIQAKLHRGGWYGLNINSDTTVVFDSPDMCGFGLPMREGRWKVNSKDTSITFSFSKSIGKMNYPGTKDINETETYKIKKITGEELILTRLENGKQSIWPFILTNNIK